MIPPKFSLVRKLFGQNALRQPRQVPSAAYARIPHYLDLKDSFLNVDDEQRTFLASNFQQLEEAVSEYLVFNKLIPDPFRQPKTQEGKPVVHISRPADVLKARIEFLGMRVEARHL